MFNLLLPLIFAASTANPINGLWKLPGKEVTELMVAEHNGSVVGLFRVNVSCKPAYMPFRGTITRSKGKVSMSLESPEIKISGSCKVIFAIISHGKLVKNRYKTHAAIISNVVCADKKNNRLDVDNVSGVWKRIKKRTPRKLPKHRKRIPREKGKPISI